MEGPVIDCFVQAFTPVRSYVIDGQPIYKLNAEGEQTTQDKDRARLDAEVSQRFPWMHRLPSL